jgi:3-hydroxyisobutyrate dehydrogenase-like beta-hydroxyacid dehydrogenase
MPTQKLNTKSVPKLRLSSSASSAKNTQIATPKVGVVGLGIMGSSIATNLHIAGFQVFGFDPSKEQQKLLKKVGITICQEVAKVAQECEFILLSLPSVYALKAVTEEIANNAQKGTIVAELGTLPHEAKEEAAITFSHKKYYIIRLSSLLGPGLRQRQEI